MTQRENTADTFDKHILMCDWVRADISLSVFKLLVSVNGHASVFFFFFFPCDTHMHAHTYITTTSWVSVCPDVGCVSAGMTSVHPWGEKRQFSFRQTRNQTAPVLLDIQAAAMWHRQKLWCLLVLQPPRRKKKGMETRREAGVRREMEGMGGRMAENICVCRSSSVLGKQPCFYVILIHLYLLQH